MKVMLLVGAYPRGWHLGGAEHQCLLLAKYLSARGHRIVFVALKGEKGGVLENQTDFQVFTAGSFDKNILLSFCRLILFLAKDKPEILFIRDFRYLFLHVIISKLLGIKAVYNTTHINNCYPYKQLTSGGVFRHLFLTLFIIFKQYLNFLSLKFISVITINKSQVEILSRQNVKGICIYNSMEDNYPIFKRAKKRQVVWAANIKSRKRPEFFFRLAELFKNSGAEFIMIGNNHGGQFYSRLIEEAARNIPRFRYLGGKTIEEVDQILAESMILVNTCEPEGFGNNFIQAWLNECATVTLEFDPDNIIERKKIGFRSGNLEQMVIDINYLLENPEICLSLGLKARTHALKNHLIEQNGARYEKYFLDLIKYGQN